MTTKKKVKNAMPPAQQERHKVPSAKSGVSDASLEEQIAMLEERITLLKKETGDGVGVGVGKTGLPKARSPKPETLPYGATTFLQSWHAEQRSTFEKFSELVPQLANTCLTSGERKRLNGSGVRRYGFIEKVSDVAEKYPQFWPASIDADETLNGLRERVREIDVLRNLLSWQQFLTRVIGDLSLIAGDDAFRTANMYYASVRAAAQSNLPEADQVVQLLNLFWKRRHRTKDTE